MLDFSILLVLVQVSRQTTIPPQPSMQQELQILKYRIATLEGIVHALLNDRSTIPIVSGGTHVRSSRMRQQLGQLNMQESMEFRTAMYLPVPNQMRERTVLIGESGPRTLVLGDRLFKSQKSLIFAIENLPGHLIKYQTGCGSESDGLHELVRDYILMRLIGSTGRGIVPAVKRLSPGVLLPSRVSPKTKFNMMPVERLQCVANNGMLRYMIMEDCGFSLHRWMEENENLGIRMGLKLLVDIVSHVFAIHSLGIIHGDIHSGNVLVDASHRVFLIDLGIGLFDDEVEDVEDSELEVRNLCIFSPYEIQGHIRSYRDDIFRAIMMGAFMIGGNVWKDHCKSLEDDEEGMMEFKTQSFLFDVPGEFVLGSQHPESLTGPVRQHLEAVLGKIRNIPSVQDKPDYEGILHELRSAYLLVESFFS